MALSSWHTGLPSLTLGGEGFGKSKDCADRHLRCPLFRILCILLVRMGKASHHSSFRFGAGNGAFEIMGRPHGTGNAMPFGNDGAIVKPQPQLLQQL